MTTKTPRPPSGLGTRGRRYWREVLGAYELTDSELHLLTEACRTLDDLDRLAEAVERDGATVAGSTGQTVVHPALTEARGQRIVLHRLIAALSLPDAEGDVVPGARSAASQAANAARWRGHVKGA